MNNQNVPTFEQNIQEVCALKEQLLKLSCMYSPTGANYHQMLLIKQLKSEVQKSQSKIIQFRQQTLTNYDKNKEKIFTLQHERDQLLQINEKLVSNCQQVAKKLNYLEKKNQELEEKVQQLSVEKNNVIKQFQQQIGNLELIHAQELYIAKKKKN